MDNGGGDNGAVGTYEKFIVDYGGGGNFTVGTEDMFNIEYGDDENGTVGEDGNLLKIRLYQKRKV